MSELKKYERSSGGTTRRGAKRKSGLAKPVMGMEAEFNVWLDEAEINPEPYWVHPKAFIDAPLLKREKTSSHIPTGGAVYFDRGVIEVVTPVIELMPGCSARVVRSLWEQIGFVREHLTRWGQRTGHEVRLKAYSSHYNISYELKKRDENKNRNINKLALLLAHLLPVPVMIVAANRRSTGIGVRPRGDRIEITVDFTPDPSLMIATATLLVGVIREIISWDSYDESLLDKLPLPTIANVIPGKHTTRKGWLTKDFHYPQSPYTADIDEPMWKVRDGRTMSLRQIALEVAWFFRMSIRRHSDPFSFRLLFAILEGRSPSLLELDDRPLAYEDVGRLCKWGSIIDELRDFERAHELSRPQEWKTNELPMRQFLSSRDEERAKQAAEKSAAGGKGFVPDNVSRSQPQASLNGPRRSSRVSLMTAGAGRPVAQRASKGREGDEYLDRRTRSVGIAADRRAADRRRQAKPVPFPDRRLTRSAYEQVFLKLVSGGTLVINGQNYTPVGMKGWYEAIFRRESDGVERLISIDQLLKRINDWK